MDIGMTMPLMEPDLNREILEQWATGLDRGPFSTLAVGERIAFWNPEVLTALAACAAWTNRIRLATTVVIAPTHDPVRLAKQLATVDLISNGRLSVGLGVGGRDEDYRAVGVDPNRIRQAELARVVSVMRGVWRGDRWPADAPQAVGPSPIQRGGPPLLSGAMGPRATRAAAEWAETVTGWAMIPDLKEIERQFEQTRSAWRQAGKAPPRLITSFWIGMGSAGRGQIAAHVHRYLGYFETKERAKLAALAGFAGSIAEIRAFLGRLADLGADEVILGTTTSDPQEIQRATEILS